MKKYYSKSDIEEFLAQNDYGLWTMNIFDKKTNKTRNAEESDFDIDVVHTFEIIDTYDDKTFKDFAISNFRFAEIKYTSGKKQSVNEFTLTINWCSSLIEKNGKEYALELQNWCNDNIKTIDEVLTKKEKNLTQPQKNKFINIKSFYAKLIEVTKMKVREFEDNKNLSV